MENFDNEQWRDIAGYEGMYQVSDLGRVRSLKFGKVRVLKPNKNKYGYLCVDLHRDGNRKTVKIHRLVAQAFIQNDDETKTQINHIDECKQNNRLWNLEYCTPQYNVTYNDLQHRRKHPKYRRDKVKELYDPNLTYAQNLEIFKANGIECGIQTVFNLRKDLGLTKNKRDKLKPLYRPDLSINENLEIFKANGIECSNITVLRLRKDLGLTKPYSPRNKAN